MMSLKIARPILITTLLLTGCKKQGPPDELAAENAHPHVEVQQTAVPSTAEAVLAMKAQFARVHFETDSSKLDATGQQALATNVAIMQKHPSLQVEIQGHADERGTSDYNLALGDRRANAVRKYMIAQGLAPTRVTVITYGEERPVVPGTGDFAWSQNRRAEFRILARSESDALVAGTAE
ncbi:MAG: OmpA family protein [Deltaproteobacteria bacterium]|nr:MAG: OmpA family protein [Deltaproteobacteria bacterium]